MSAIMFDAETLGRTAGCTVLSIGAVEFDSTKIIKEFEIRIDPRDSQRRGCHMDADTVMWWLDQSKEAQNALKGDVFKMDYALGKLVEAFKWKNKQVWCNGASFDFPIIGALFNKCDMEIPWAFWNEMDMRTIKNMVGRDKWKASCIEPTVAHSALADAVGQAKTLQKVFANGGSVTWQA